MTFLKCEPNHGPLLPKSLARLPACVGCVGWGTWGEVSAGSWRGGRGPACLAPARVSPRVPVCLDADLPPPGLLAHTPSSLRRAPGLCYPPSEHPSHLCSCVLLDAARCPIFLGVAPLQKSPEGADSIWDLLPSSRSWGGVHLGRAGLVAGGAGAPSRAPAPGRTPQWIGSPCPLLRPVAHQICSCAPRI